MLKEQIIKTLRYFDVQELCLTLLEIEKYLLQQDFGRPQATTYTTVQIMEEIEKMPERVKEEQGFYCLPGRQELVRRRLDNNLYATPRLKKARKFLKYMRFIPFVSAVALGGSEARSSSKKGSDIDLFILTKPKRMWLARLLATAFFHLTGHRRHGQKISDRFCLNHYIVEGKKLDSDQNVYTAIEYFSLMPFFGGSEIYAFQKSNLEWFKQYLSQPIIQLKSTPKSSFFKRAFEFTLNNRLGDLLDRLASKLQKGRIQLQEHILVSDNELSFHPGSKGQAVLSKFRHLTF